MAAQPKPAYQQIADDIRQRILDGVYQAGDKLPTEADLMAEYGVSRIVVRNAVQALVSEGLVTTQRGKGMFVREQRPLRKRISGDLYGKRPVASPMKRQTEAEEQALRVGIPDAHDDGHEGGSGTAGHRTRR